MRRLRELADLVSGQHVLASGVNTDGRGVAYLTGPSDFVGETPAASSWTEHGTAFAEAGDILVTVKGSGCGTLAIADRRYAISRQLMAVRPRSTPSRFLWAALSREVERLNASAAGTIPGLTRDQILDIEIPLLDPSLELRVAAVDGLYSNLLHAVARALTAKCALKRALLHDLLTGRRRFPEFTDDSVETTRLSELCHIQIGGTPRRNEPAFWAARNAAGFPWVSIGDMRQRIIRQTSESITREGIDGSSVKLVPAGTVLMSFKLTIGRVARAGCDLYTNEAIAAFLPKEGRVVPGYLERILPLAVLEAEPDIAVKGATLNKAKLADIAIRLPSVAEQQRIAKLADLLDDNIEQTERLRDACEAHKRALMRRLLCGDIPLPAPADTPALAHA